MQSSLELVFSRLNHSLRSICRQHFFLSLHYCNFLAVCWRSWTWLSWRSVAEWAWWSAPPRWRRLSRPRSTRSRTRSSPSDTDSTPASSWPLSGPGSKLILQCCGSGSGIRYFFDPRIRDGQKIRIRIRDEQPGSYFRDLKNNIFKFFDVDPGSGMEKIGSGP